MRAPAMLFNEKVSCGLGRGIAATGRMSDEGIEKAIASLTRYCALCKQVNVTQIFPIATAAAREAENGPEFIRQAEDILQTEIQILTGKQEAHYSAQGIISAFRKPDGIVGDLGGGSLELVAVDIDQVGTGTTLPLGVIRLEERADGSLKEAMSIATEGISGAKLEEISAGKPFYAVGGTWRNFAKLHMYEVGYPLHITHAYELSSKELLPFLDRVIAGKADRMAGIEEVSKSRRAQLPIGAIVLKAIIQNLKPSKIVFSAFGVREGFVFSQLCEDMQRRDALIEAADELAILRSRSPRHARELAVWTQKCFDAFDIDETVDESRYREAACRLADIGWRAHPDYRAAQSIAIIAYGHFVQISHQGRAFIALANYFRYQGLKNEELAPEIKQVTSDRIWNRARYLGAFFRVGYLFTAAMPGVLGELEWRQDDNGMMVLKLPATLKILAGERPDGRVAQLAKVMERDIRIEIG